MAASRSKPVAVEARPVVPGFRRLSAPKGFAPPGKYAGVESYVAVHWNDAAGKEIGPAPGFKLPYHPVDWDLGDRFCPGSRRGRPIVLTANLNNHSQRHVGGTSLPRCGWTDGRFATTTRRPRRSGPCKRSRGLSKAA